ncbi:MAG: GGDEF domain-containing protein [Alphaproteobacteria bacterium]
MMAIRDKGENPPRRGESAAAGAARPGTQDRADGSDADVALILGVSASELTAEVRQAVANLSAEAESLRRELRETRSKVSYLERLADQDALVPVINRRAFARELSRTMSYARRYNVPCSVLYFDVNELKEINDGFGHAAGDAALSHVAETLIASVREFDIVGRLGGDEFGVILVHVDDKGAAEKAATLAGAVPAKPLVFRGNTIVVTVAYGSYQFRPDENVEHAIDAADKMMYARKKDAATK